MKVDFVKEKGLGGLMAWELSQDLQASEELSLLGLINKRLAEQGMERTMRRIVLNILQSDLRM